MPLELTFVHLTDLHILAKDDDEVFGVRPIHKLRQIMAYIQNMDVSPDFFVISGDLTHHGRLAEYYALNKALEELRAYKAPIITGLGNMDNRSAFRQVMLDEEAADETQRYYHSTVINGLRIIMLDTLVSGEVYGTLDPPQRAWLQNEVQQPAPRGSLIALHHPPVYSTVKQLNNRTLTNPNDLAQAIDGQRVLGILSGHIHYSLITTFVGIPSITTPAVAYCLDPTIRQTIRGVDNSGFTLGTIHDGRLYCNPIIMRNQSELYAIDLETDEWPRTSIA